jgi:transposase
VEVHRATPSPQPRAKEGKPRADDKRIIDAILYVLKISIPWNDLPKEYGDDYTANRRLRRWEKREGVWKRIMDALLSDGYSEGRLSIDKLSIDSDIYQSKRGPAHRLRRPQEGQCDEDTRGSQ